MVTWDKNEGVRTTVVRCEKLFIETLDCKKVFLRYVVKTPKMESFCTGSHGKIISVHPQKKKKT